MKHRKLDTTPEISKRMANVKLKGGNAETILAKLLWHNDIRYRKNFKKLPGSPDIAITKYKIAVFVDGEFWHGENWEFRKKKLKKNKDYWIEKIEENMARDKRNDLKLIDAGWTVVHFWEKEVLKNSEYCLEKVLALIEKRNSEDD